VTEAVARLFDRRFQVVVGKGGVGRTLVASALALRAARDGKRTLLLEINAPDDCARRLGVPPAIDVPKEVLPNLWLCRMTPEGSLKEYALLILKFKALYNLVFENRLVKYLLRSIPSMGEFTMLGKAWYHENEKNDDGTPRFDRIIVDAPATGHAITFLSVARTVADITPPGVMQEASEKMAKVIESPTDSALHVVTLPEEMPVNEGLEMLAAAKTKLRMAPGVGVVNRMLPAMFLPAEERVLSALDRERDVGLRPYLVAANGRRVRESFQAAHLRRFAQASQLPTFSIPDFGTHALGRTELDLVVQIFDREVAR
jgi:hypothetical protein